ncbi:MAG: hypothetical protein JSR45_15475 [Proteobacteria bacterium]|nr:hypothetical protein [Pseudomonadota bacterium]
MSFSRRAAWAAGLSILVSLQAGGFARAAEAPVDWRKAALGDIQAARTILLDNSPGGAPGVDTAFRRRIDLATKLASADAASVDSLQGYHFALEHFAQTFQDNHLWIDFEDPLPIRWPGFLMGYRDGRLVVADTSDGVKHPLGAELVSCDGAPAAAMARRRLQPYVGQWSVVSSRRRVAPYLLVDQGSPFAPAPKTCSFRQAGRTWSQTLTWNEIQRADFTRRLKAARHIASEPKGGVRATADGGYWIGIPTLNALDPSALAGLEVLMKEIEAKAPEIRSANYFVIDLRGNSGGNTFVALRVMNAIWGEGAVAGVRPKALRAEWRASPANIAYLEAVQPVLKQLFGADSLAYSGLAKILGGFRRSTAEGKPIFVDPDEYSILHVWDGGARHTVGAKPFLLTDGGCVSSCLNLVDMVLKLPRVTQIGDETASDTNMLENRASPLPSGHAALEFPIKLYRNRERRSYESYKPAYAWTGDMDDDAALERWVAGLPRS